MPTKPEKPTEFETHAEGRRRSTLVGELWRFLLHNKKWWMLPILLVILLLGVLVLLSASSGVAPFIYTLF